MVPVLKARPAIVVNDTNEGRYRIFRFVKGGRDRYQLLVWGKDSYPSPAYYGSIALFSSR